MRWTCVSTGIAALAAFALLPANAAETAAAADRLFDARSLLRAGQVQQALDQALLAEQAAPEDAGAAALLGQIYFRKADFQAAERYFTAALRIDPDCAQALVGLGRLDQLHFRRKAARQKFAQAYELTPDDPEVVLAYAGAADRDEEIALLERYVSLASGDRREREAALGRLAFHKQTGGRELEVLDGPYRAFRLRMGLWVPQPGRPAGLLLKVSINFSRPLSLLFDTGAGGIFLNPKAAEKLGLEYLSDSGARGAGDEGAMLTRKTLAGTLRIDDLRLRNCIVEVTDRPITDEADGVIGASVFKQFILRLDPQRKQLDLIPYPEGAPQGGDYERMWAERDRAVPTGVPDLIPVCQVGRLLLVNAKVNDAAGYLVLDTGAAYTSVSRRIAPAPARRPGFAASGADGTIADVARAGAVRLGIAGYDVTDPDAITFDFRRVSNREGVEITGLIGYPVLSRSPLTIDYRDGLIGFGR